MIYVHPSISKLAALVHDFLYGTEDDQTPSRCETIDSLVTKYTADLPQQDHVEIPTSEMLTVALTGSTRSLGSYLLDTLRSDLSISKIYCLTRDGKPESQTKALQDRGLDPTLPSNKIEFIKTSLGEYHLGIEDTTYEKLLQSADTIIHNAWRMDFNIPVESFEQVHIRAVRSLVDFCAQSAHRAHLHFLSSISAGYSEAKHICERICLATSERSGVPSSVHRVGQIAGSAGGSGYWNRYEWLPAIFATSKSIGKIPEGLGGFPVDWVPVDLLSRIIIETVHTRRNKQREDPFDVFHLINPTAKTWASLLDPVHAMYGHDGHRVETVSVQHWIKELEQIKTPTAEDLASKPALKLLAFYQSLVVGGNSDESDESPAGAALFVPLDVNSLKAASATMRVLSHITPGMMAAWLGQWGF